MNSPVAWALLFHIVGFVFWIGGLLFATQVLAMHTQETSPAVGEALTRLERKVMKGIAHPGAAITVLAGILVVYLQPDYMYQHWLHAKLFLVAILIGLDLIFTFRARAFQAGKLQLKRSECKILHGAISLVFLGILVMVMIKPF
jgi:protoporphyrinogen IX oxidase